jgi:hypothetical protein
MLVEEDYEPSRKARIVLRGSEESGLEKVSLKSPADPSLGYAQINASTIRLRKGSLRLTSLDGTCIKRCEAEQCSDEWS